jgi:hypothetical protein
MFTLTTVFVTLRTIVRFKILHRLSADDVLIIFAWMMTLTNVALFQWINDGMYLDNAMAALVLMPTPEIIAKANQWLKVDAATLVLFYSSLWAVKLSFLLFFRRLYHQIRWLQIYWWIVLAINVATWIVCVGTIPWACLIPPFEVIIQHCASEAKADFNRHVLYSSTAMDLLSDLLILSIPLSVLWGVHISRTRKVALGAIFSLTIITMTIAIIRAALVTTATTADLDTPWVVLWSFIEQCIGKRRHLILLKPTNGQPAVMVGCLAFFKTLFTNSHPPSTPRQYREDSTDDRKRKNFQGVTALISEIANMESLVSGDETSRDWHDDSTGLTRLKSKDTSQDGV